MSVPSSDSVPASPLAASSDSAAPSPVPPSPSHSYGTDTRPTHESDEDEAGDFDCNICLSPCVDPVVTRCGHLYCWTTCIGPWMQRGNGECPVCKAGISRDNMTPLYGRGATTKRRKGRKNQHEETTEGTPEAAAAASATSSSSSSSSASASASASSTDLPPRPSGERPPPPNRPQHNFWGAPAPGVGGDVGNGGGAFGFGPFGFFIGGGSFGLLPFMFHHMHGGLQPNNGQPREQSTFGNIMLFVGMLVIIMLIYA